jgi:Tol biopolymer transport system component
VVAGLALALLVPAVPAHAGLGEVRPVSLISGGSAFGDQESFDPIVSRDGRFVLFTSTATNLVPGQSGGPDPALFLRELSTGQTTLVSHAAGDPGAARIGEQPSMSADGRFVAYISDATDLLAAPTTAGPKVFLFDRATGANVLVSHAATSPTTNANDESFLPDVSADGRFVAYESTASNIVTGQTEAVTADDVFLYEVATGVNTLVSHTAASPTTTGDASSRRATISDDGGRVAFQSQADDLTAGADASGNAVFVFERSTGLNRVVSRDASVPANSANNDSFRPLISGDGQWVLFRSSATTLVPGFDNNNEMNVDAYVAAVDSNTTLLASHGPGGPADGATEGIDIVGISSDGMTSLFHTTAANQVPGQIDTNAGTDAFTFNRGTGAVTLASAVPSNPIQAGDGSAAPTGISADGRFAGLESGATNLVSGQQEGNIDEDAFVRDLALGTTRLLSHATGSFAATANARSDGPSLSGDGLVAAFNSAATDLVPAPLDGNGAFDVFAAVNIPPVASAAERRNPGASPLKVTFDGMASSDPDGVIVGYAWNHGDGTFGAGPTSDHTYAAPGTYTATLAVRDDAGATATTTLSVTVTDSPPVLRDLRVVPSAFAPLGRGGSIRGSQRARGASVHYRLSETARVRFTVQRRTTGRRVGRRCVKRTRRNGSRRRCARFVAVRGAFTHQGSPSSNHFGFTGRIRRRALRPARYRLVARAADPRGNRSRVARAPFRIVRRR